MSNVGVSVGAGHDICGWNIYDLTCHLHLPCVAHGYFRLRLTNITVCGTFSGGVSFSKIYFVFFFTSTNLILLHLYIHICRYLVWLHTQYPSAIIIP